MSAQVILGKTTYTVRDADHLEVVGDLVRIQRSSPNGFETVAVAGSDLLVTIEPGERAKVVGPATNGVHWHPVGEPLDFGEPLD